MGEQNQVPQSVICDLDAAIKVDILMVPPLKVGELVRVATDFCDYEEMDYDHEAYYHIRHRIPIDEKLLFLGWQYNFRIWLWKGRAVRTSWAPFHFARVEV